MALTTWPFFGGFEAAVAGLRSPSPLGLARVVKVIPRLERAKRAFQVEGSMLAGVHMRRAVLLRSVRERLGEQVVVRDAAYVWNRHRWVIPYATAVFTGLVWLAPVAGIGDWPTRIVIGLAGLGVAVNSSSNYRVVAETDQGMVVLRASRIRQVAIGPPEKLAADAELEPVGGTLLATDWRVGEDVYTVARSSEHAMERMAGGRSSTM